MQYQRKEIPGFLGYYVDTEGFIWSIKIKGSRGKLGNVYRKLILPKDKRRNKGYARAFLCNNGKVYYKRVHRLVLEAFTGPCPGGMQACHNNGIPDDNRIENLRWDTPKSNCKDRIKHGMMAVRRGIESNFAKLTEKKVRIIRWLLKYSEMRQREIADIFCVCQQTISLINIEKNWKSVLQSG